MYAASTEQQRRSAVQSLATQLYRERYRYLLRIATRNVDNDADAEEALQEAFASFIAAYDPSGGAPPLAWLTTTLKRACWARYREMQRGCDHFGLAGDSIPTRAAGTEQRVARIDEARVRLAALKPAERRTLGLIATGYSYKEIGAITGFSYTKTNRCASEGRAALRCLT
jgi:DNA-directed RNA polymerase specialized sigma24 family protein